MQVQDVKKIADQALESLAESLRQGKSEVMLQFLAAMAKFHRYSFSNIMLIASQRPDATHVAGFRTWQKLNRYVKKGEMGIVIYAPMRFKVDESADADKSRAKSVLRFRGVYVFDVSQTDGDPLPEIAIITGDPAEHTSRLLNHVRSCGITVTYADLPPKLSGYSSGGAITLRNGLTPADEFATLVHEYAHEKLHHGPNAVKGSKTTRETEAEAVAYVVSQAIGLTTGTASSDYIQLYQGDEKVLAASLDRIQRTVGEILAAIQPASESLEIAA